MIKEISLKMLWKMLKPCFQKGNRLKFLVTNIIEPLWSDGITKFIYRKISTAQSPIVENNQQDNNTNKVVETTNQNKDEVNEKEQNQANTSVTNT